MRKALLFLFLMTRMVVSGQGGMDLDYQILIEADFLVNLYEDSESEEAIRTVRKNIFRTESGLKMLDDMFLTACDRNLYFSTSGRKQNLPPDAYS